MSAMENDRPRVALSPYYRSIATSERKQLSQAKSNQLTERLSDTWDRGPLLAWLSRIKKKMQKIGMEQSDLASRFRLMGSSAVSKWFATGEIGGPRAVKLIMQPEFADCKPPIEEMRLHEHREAITWIKIHTLGEQSSNLLRWDEFIFLCLVHESSERNLDTVFGDVPDVAKSAFPKFDADKLVLTIRRWGTAFRLYCLERCDDD